MAPDAPNRSDPAKPAKPVENGDEFLARLDREFKQLDQDIERAAKEGEALKHEPEL